MHYHRTWSNTTHVEQSDINLYFGQIHALHDGSTFTTSQNPPFVAQMDEQNGFLGFMNAKNLILL